MDDFGRMTRLERLEWARDQLVAAIRAGSERERLAPLVKELRETEREIAALAPATKSRLDDLADRRKNRRANPPSAGVAVGDGG